MTNVLQSKIKACLENSGQYAVAFVRDSNDVNYFIVPDVKTNGIWINGLDGKDNVSECIQLFVSRDEAVDCLQAVGNRFVNNGYSKAKLFETIFHKENHSLELSCVEEFTKSEKIG